MAGKKVGKDSGYIFANPMVERKRKTVKPGQTLIDNHKSGVIVADNKESPWYTVQEYTVRKLKLQNIT